MCFTTRGFKEKAGLLQSSHQKFAHSWKIEIKWIKFEKDSELGY